MSEGQRKGEGNQHWRTPPEVVEALHDFEPITLDPCSNADSIVGAERSYCPPVDGLDEHTQWDATHTYVNPPYGNQAEWVKRAVRASWFGESRHVTMLLPFSPETKLWRENIFVTAAVICCWRRRINFLGAKKSGNTLPSGLIYWGPEGKRFARHFRTHGTILTAWECAHDE